MRLIRAQHGEPVRPTSAPRSAIVMRASRCSAASMARSNLSSVISIFRRFSAKFTAERWQPGKYRQPFLPRRQHTDDMNAPDLALLHRRPTIDANVDAAPPPAVAVNGADMLIATLL